MIDKLQQQIENLTQQHENRKRWLAILAVLAVMVVAATAYALVRPAITLENTTHCGLEEHTHTEACYASVATAETAASDQELTCGKEEHTHTLACYADPTADIENEEDWANSVAQAELTGNWGDDLANVAQSQLGYTASEKNYTVALDGETKQPYTRYGAWSGDAYTDWNLPFVNFCLHYAQIPAEAFPVEADFSSLMEALTDDDRDQFAPADGYVPQAGDVALLTNNGEDISAVGIVAELCAETDDQPAKVAVIEADDSNTVCRVEYALDDEKLLGYGVMPENTDAEQAPEETATFATENLDNVAVYARRNSKVVSLSAEPKFDTILSGTKLTLKMFTITATYSDGTTGVLPEPAVVTSPNWPQKYPNDMRETNYNWTNTFPGVGAIEVSFKAGSEIEANHDMIRLYDKEGTKQQELSGTEMAGKRYLIPGDSAKITMSSDHYGALKGFSAVVSAAIHISPERVPETEGDFTVSLTMLDGTGTPTEVSATAKLTAERAPTSGICGENAQWNYSDGTLTISGSGSTYDYAEGEAPWNILDVQKFIVENGITSIGTYYFSECQNLQSVTIPADVDVDKLAFWECKAITELNVTSTTEQEMKTCPAVIVRYCTGDLKVTLSDGVKLPWASAFGGCTALKSIKLEGDFKSIPLKAFYRCENLESVEIPESVTDIGTWAFENCKALKTIDIPDGVEGIAEEAFYGCENLDNIVLPDKITRIYNGTFKKCSNLKTVAIPDSVVSISSDAFSSCYALQTVTFGKQSALESIGSYAFAYCKNLKKIELPDAVTKIDYNAFSNSGLERLTIPQNVETVGYRIVDECANISGLKWNAKNGTWNETAGVYKGKGHLTITVGNSVETLSAKTMQSFITWGATDIQFEGQNWLNIENAGQMGNLIPLSALTEGNYYADEYGGLYRLENDRAVLVYLPRKMTTYTIPATVPADETGSRDLPVTAVGSNALKCAADLEELTFQAPKQIAELGDGAFAYAPNLGKINGATTATAVLDQFSTECKKGQFLFRETKIGEPAESIMRMLHLSGLPDSGENNTLEVTVKTSESTKYPTPVAEDETQVYYTGEAAVTTVSISNPASARIEEDDGAVVRLYMDFDNESGKPQIAEGDYTIEVNSGTEYTYKVSRVVGINLYCFEVQRPRNGDTITLNLGSGYASPATGGGANRIFGAILSKAEKEKLKDDELPYIDQYQNLRWETKVDRFPVTKERVKQSVQMLGDGAGHAYIKGLAYNINVAREGDTLEGVGKDLMTSMDCTDVLTLPEGITLNDTVINAIQTNSYVWGDYQRAYTADGTQILEISKQGANATLKDYNLAIDESGNLVIHWTIANSTIQNAQNASEMPNLTVKVTFGEKALYLDSPEAEKSYEIQNEVSVTEHFSYSEDQIRTAKCLYELTSGEGKLNISKRLKSGSAQMGDSRVYTISANNPAALPYEKLAFLDDEMTYTLYLSADDIVTLFQSDQEKKQVSLTLENATICTPPDSTVVRGMDGEIAGNISVSNTDAGTDDNKYRGMSKSGNPTVITDTARITVSWSKDDTVPNRLCFTLNDPENKIESKTTSSELNEKDIQNLLDSWGYLVTYRVTYKVRWDLRDETGKFSLLGGQQVSYDLRVTNKDAFMILETDQKYQYPTASVGGTNGACGYTAKEEKLGSQSVSASIYREFSLVKEADIDGQDVTLNPDTLQDGSIIDYKVTVNHSSDAYYDILPLTDHMSGSQVLLAEVDRNQNATWAQELETVKDETGTEYYKLEKERIYDGVWLNGWYADSVQVTNSNTGRDTLIKWYFSDYEGTRADTISYKAQMQLAGQTNGTYHFHNETWLGDHETHRLYNEVGWVRLDYTFDKKIVENETDRGEGLDSCPITEGQTVTYRLKLQTIQQGPYTLTGINLYDELPKSLGKNKEFVWQKGDGKKPGTVDIVRYDYPESGSVKNEENWSITTDANDKNRQYIKWDNDFSITFGHDPVYIYVRLTYPTGEAWQAYAKQYGAQTLENTFYVEGVPDTVTHVLSLPAKAYLQKGVWKTFSVVTTDTDQYQYVIDSPISTGRWYYSNDDIVIRYVCYYVTLRNDGLSRLYLNDFQDTLPKGFTLESLPYKDPKEYFPGKLTTSTSYDSEIYTSAKKNPDGTKVRNKCVTVTASIADDTINNKQKLTFHFTPYPYTGSEAVQYDKDLDKCYLNPGEEIQFAYYCRTNSSEDTEDVATNTVTMPYYDYTGGGFELGDGQQIALKSDTYTPNDGTCVIWDNSTAAANGYAAKSSDLIAGDENATKWLESDVTIRRGGIAPGITKKLEAKVDQSDVITQEPLVAHPVDTLRWGVVAQNNGTLPIVDYTLSDTMPTPYEFVGSVKYTVTGGDGEYKPIGKAVVSLFDIEKTEIANVLKITSHVDEGSYGYQSVSANLEINGDPLQIDLAWHINGARNGYYRINTTAVIRMTQDPTTKATTLWIHFTDPRMSIPEGGVATLTLDTKIPDKVAWRNTVYTNACNITPMVQPWDTSAVNQGNATTQTPVFDDKERASVRNSAPVTVSYGYATTSLKTVEEVNNAYNKANSNSDRSYIVLPGRDSTFRYTLAVNNEDPTGSGQKNSMDELIFIDSLPQQGDHTVFQTDDPRYSDFTVSLADEYDPVVTIKAKGGTTKTLEKREYKLEFSARTEFTTADWDGTSTWDASPAQARSVRLILKDPNAATGTDPLMPSGSTISLSFVCKVDDPNAAAGQIAWNSFGYHYIMHGTNMAQEAAPLKVGVMLPTQPTLQKKLQLNGAPYTAERDETFTFYCYTGQPLTDLPENWTAAQLEAKLTEARRDWRIISVAVTAGDTASAVQQLTDTEKWTWQKNQVYTIVEVPNDRYTLTELNGIQQNTYTFTYDPARSVAITAVNTRDSWSFTLEKVDEDAPDTHLADAWFALYSKDDRDIMTDEAYAALTCKAERTITDGDTTWYLTQVGVTRADTGYLTFTGLTRDEYRCKEIKAPNGYAPDETLHTITREDNAKKICKITNRRAYRLPNTGGCGTTPFTVAGLLLIAAASCLLFKKYRRKQEGGTASSRF